MIILRIRCTIRNLLQRNSSSSIDKNSLNLKKTALFDFHINNGGKMIEFCKWAMPVHYKSQSIIESYSHTRNSVSVFDVSHMQQTLVAGKESLKYLEQILVADLQNLSPKSATLTCFTNQKAGIIDDAIITKDDEDTYYIVSNASTSLKVTRHIETTLHDFNKNNSSDITVNFIKDRSLLAIQGPLSSNILQKTFNYDFSKLYFMQSLSFDYLENSVRITRCGYTGEDGFEISIHNDNVNKLLEKIIFLNKDVKIAGLGSRDLLRLESGLCLYGNDINEETTPVEATLSWIISTRRRQTGGFPGWEYINQQINEPNKYLLKRRIGLCSNVGPSARNGCTIFDENNQEIGLITSGCPSPSLKQNIAMAYINTINIADLHNKEYYVQVHGRKYQYRFNPLPFVKAKYYYKPKLAL